MRPSIIQNWLCHLPIPLTVIKSPKISFFIYRITSLLLGVAAPVKNNMPVYIRGFDKLHRPYTI